LADTLPEFVAFWRKFCWRLCTKPSDRDEQKADEERGHRQKRPLVPVGPVVTDITANRAAVMASSLCSLLKAPSRRELHRPRIGDREHLPEARARIRGIRA